MLSAKAVRTPSEEARYVGDAACKSCHLDVFKKWSQSAHESALNPVTVQRYGTLFRDPQVIRDESTGISYHPAVDQGKCVVVMADPNRKIEIQALIGMGAERAGVTFLGRDQLNRWVALRISHYAMTQHWDYSPQQSPDLHGALDPAGDLIASRADLESCLSCHVTTLRMNGDTPDLQHSRLNVGCERCHGPGRAHVESMDAKGRPRGPGFVAMERLRQAPAARILEICAPCHNSPGGAGSAAPESQTDVARFQSTAFMRSECYRNSRTFSCITCHDPHKDVLQDNSTYEAVCLSCHAAGRPAQRAHARVCKVNPLSDCISCHMPATLDPTAPSTLFHDHWIKVWPGKT